MKLKTLLVGFMFLLFFIGCEEEEITSINDIIGRWEHENAEINVQKNGDEAWVTYIAAEYEVTYGINPGFTVSGANCVINSNYEFSYNSSGNSVTGEFKSPQKLVLKCNIDGNNVRYVLTK